MQTFRDTYFYNLKIADIYVKEKALNQFITLTC